MVFKGNTNGFKREYQWFLKGIPMVFKGNTNGFKGNTNGF